MRSISVPKANGYLIFKPMYLGRLPIRRITFTTPPAARTRETAKAKLLCERGPDPGARSAILAHVERVLGQRPEQADVVHDMLAFLAEQMIVLNRQQQDEVHGFLRWLERKIGAAVERLANKTRLRAYHEYDFAGLLEVLRQNRRQLTVDPDARATQDAVEREFSKSLDKLAPLKAKIAATDRLIDQVVYRLYGLTAEEIAIVEGGSPGRFAARE
jgi:hypothetical protein